MQLLQNHFYKALKIHPTAASLGLPSPSLRDTGLSGLVFCLFGGDTPDGGRMPLIFVISFNVGEQVVPSGVPGCVASLVHGFEWLVLAVLLEDGHHQVVWPGNAARQHMIRRWRLRGPFAGAENSFEQIGRPSIPVARAANWRGFAGVHQTEAGRSANGEARGIMHLTSCA